MTPGNRVGLVALALAILAAMAGCHHTIDQEEPPVIEPRDNPMLVATLCTSEQEDGISTSSSHNWAQLAPDGSIGIVYCENKVIPDIPSTCRMILKTISPDGQVKDEEVAVGSRMENAVLLLDSLGQPHLFGVRGDGASQDLVHFFKNPQGSWESETASRFANQGGEYLMEFTAALGPQNSLHLAVLQFGANPERFLTAHERSNLYYLKKQCGVWKQERVQQFDSVYILLNIGYWYMRPLRRLDLAIDATGFAHIAYGALAPETGVANSSGMHPSEMRYATNRKGTWSISILRPVRDSHCEAGYNPSIAIDSHGRVALACTYLERVPTGSATSSQLIYSELAGESWTNTVLVEYADGYLGYDQGRFSGAIPHLVFDEKDHPHILFSDIASTHVGSGSFLNVGQIRLIRFNGQNWELSTLYHQQNPRGYDHIEEVHSQCLLLAKTTDAFFVVARDFIARGADHHSTSLLLLKE